MESLENLLYRFLDHDDLVFRPDLCTIKYEDNIIIENYGCILPSQKTMNYLINLRTEMNLSTDKEVLRAFELEVRSKMAQEKTLKRKREFIYLLDNRFKHLFLRIPMYARIISKIQDKISHALPQKFQEDWDELDRNGTMNYYLRVMEMIINNVYNEVNRSWEQLNAEFRGGNRDHAIVSAEEVPETYSTCTVEKFKWLCNDKIAAFIITELITKGYIDTPRRGGEWSFSKTATMAAQHFEFKTLSQHTVKDLFTPSKAKNVEIYIKEKLTIPHFKDL